MDLFGGRFREHELADPVPGHALVVEVNDWLLETRTPYVLRATLVVEASGVTKTTVEHSEVVDAARGTHLDKWPEQGATIPVVVDRVDPRRLRIQWDEMVGKAERLRALDREQSDTRRDALLAEAYGAATQPPDTPESRAAPESPSMSGDSRTCPACFAAVPAGLMFCRVCGGLMC